MSGWYPYYFDNLENIYNNCQKPIYCSICNIGGNEKSNPTHYIRCTQKYYHLLCIPIDEISNKNGKCVNCKSDLDKCLVYFGYIQYLKNNI